MKNIFIVLCLAFSACASVQYMREIQIEDCVTRHLKVVSHKESLTSDFYEKIVDSCKLVYTNRP